MKNLFRFFILLNAILITIHASCPEYPTIPTTKPKLITSASDGFSNFPSSTQQLSISMLITPSEDCLVGVPYSLFAMNIGTNPDSIEVYIDCTGRSIITKGSWSAQTHQTPSLFSSPRLGPVGIFLSFDLNAGLITIQVQSETLDASDTFSSGSPGHPYFDANSQFYFCADKGGEDRTCTISDIIFEYRFYPLVDGLAHLSGTDPAIAAFYPLSGQSLAASIGSAGSAYFGDTEFNPTPATKPTWDSSDAFVTITSGQFLTFPLPDVSSTNPTVSSSFSFAAWIKVIDIPSAITTLFAMYAADGTQVGYKLSVYQSPNEIEITFSSSSIRSQNTVPTVTLNQWQLIGFTASVTKSMQFMDGTFFVGTSSAQLYVVAASPFDLSTASVIRIGDTTNSFSGQISAVRIMTPGGGIVRTTDLCSSDNSIELGVGSFALACSGSNPLNTADNECVSSCPSGTRSTLEAAIPLCVPCSKSHCSTCNNVDCLSCAANYALYQGDCLSSCPDQMFSDGSACQPCSENCAECDADGCITCDDGYQPNTEKGCVLESSTPTPTPTPITITKEKSGLSGGAVAGIACGCIVILLFILVLGGRYFKKKNDASKRVSTSNSKTSPDDIKATPISPMTSEANPLIP